MPYLTTQGDGSLYLSIHVQPRASRRAITGIHDGALKIAITAPPVEGKANKEVVAFLADFFKIPKREISIVSGLQSRKKRCRISLLSEHEIRALIAEELKKSN